MSILCCASGKQTPLLRKLHTEAPVELTETLTAAEKIADFLPSPDKLIRKTPKIKVTITLNSRSVDFFKKAAKKYNVKYQTMINEVLDQYAQKYADEGTDAR